MAKEITKNDRLGRGGRRIGVTRDDYYENRVFMDPMSGCWLWAGNYFRNGYGRVAAAFKYCASNLAHRNVFARETGTVPGDSQMVLHRCNNKSCVNPDHLYLGGRRENADDAMRDGVLRVDGKGHRKLNSQEANDIYSRFTLGEPRMGISKSYPSICSSTVYDICASKTWTHVTQKENNHV